MLDQNELKFQLHYSIGCLHRPLTLKETGSKLFGGVVPTTKRTYKIPRVLSDGLLLPMLLVAVTDIENGSHISGVGGLEAKNKHSRLFASYVPSRRLGTPVTSVISTVKLSTGNSSCEYASKHREVPL